MRLHCCRSILSTDLVFEAVGGTRTIEVKTDQATWQVESNQAWCKVAQSDGTHFTVTAEENTASEPKPQAVVTVTAGTAQAVLKVDQKGTETPPVTGTTFKITLGEPTPTGVNMKWCLRTTMRFTITTFFPSRSSISTTRAIWPYI